MADCPWTCSLRKASSIFNSAKTISPGLPNRFSSGSLILWILYSHKALPPGPPAVAQLESRSPKNWSARESRQGLRNLGLQPATEFHWDQTEERRAHPPRESESLFPGVSRVRPLE